MKNFFKNITVEPTFLIFMFVQIWLHELNNNLFLQKSCRFNLTKEPDLNTKCDDEKRGILFVSEVHASYGFIVRFLNMIILIFASIWSDKAGRRRRPLIFLPIFGLIFHALSGCFNSYFWHWLPSTAVILWALIQTVCGDLTFIMSFILMYVCDISDAENRTMRIGFALAVRSIGFILGKGGFGFILRSIGFYYFYVLCLILSVISFVLGLFLIKDRSVPVEKKQSFCRMFSLRQVLLVDSFKVVFNRKLGIKRVVVSLLLVADVMNSFAVHGEISMLYLYLRHRFKFDERMYSRYVFFKYFLASFGIVFCSFVLSKRLKIHDGLIGILATFCDTLAVIALLLAAETWQLFSSIVLDMFHSVVYTVNLSLMSKYYTSDEFGRLNAVDSAFLLITPLSYTVYNKIFQKTLDTFPSAYCILSVVLDSGIFLFFFGAYLLSRKLASKEPAAAEEELALE